MSFFSKLKDKFIKKEEKEVKEEKESLEVYDKGLTKSRNTFSSRLLDLTKRYSKVNEEYYEELEEILIMADIGVNTVMNFMDKLRKRVKEEKITDPEFLKEVIV